MNSHKNLVESEKTYRETLQRLSVEERLRIVFQLHEIGRELVLTGLRSLHPDWDNKKIEAAMKVRLYGNSREHPPVHP